MPHLPLRLFLALCFCPLPVPADEPQTWMEIPFASHHSGDLHLDIARPADEKLRPAVLCLHGGFWVKGERQRTWPLALDLVEKGYVGVTSSYRLTGTAPFPAQIEDVRAAIRFLREHAEDYGIDPQRIGVVGSSAGGHLAVLSATDPHSAPEERPNATVGMGAQSDLTAPHLQHVSQPSAMENWTKFLGGLPHEVPAQYAAASPLTHLSGEDPPIAFLAGENDHVSTHAERFRREAYRLGIPTKLTIIPEAPHNLLSKVSFREAAAEAVDAFFQTHLSGPGSSTLPLTFERTNDATAASPLSDSWLRLGGDYNGCEGAQWVHWPGSPEPELFFAAHHDGLFFRWSESRGLRLWLEGTPETSTLRPASPGFYAVEQGTRRLVHLKVNGEISQILAESFEGQRFNRPNDLRVHPEDGSVWFTDPNFLFRQRPLETQELPGQFVFRYQPQEQGKGTLTAPIQNLSIPNGIAFSETGDQLFVGDSRARTIWKYAVQADGTLGPPQSVRVFPPKNSPDGLAIAPDGHLWCAMPNGVAILDANTGEEKGFLPFSERCTSIDFIQDGDSHWVAVTTRTAAHVARFPF